MDVVKSKLVVDVKLKPSSEPRWTLADAILADLETAATPRNIYEDKWETHTTTEHATVPVFPSEVSTLNRSRGSQGSQGSRSPAPATVTSPLPLNDNYDDLTDPKEFYRTRSPGQPVYSSTITISKSVYNPNGDEDGYHRSQSVSPGPSRFDQVPQSTKSQFPATHSGPRQLSSNASEPTRLSNNLSELDTLLDDLNSAQFYAEVNKTSQNSLGNHRISPQPSGTVRSQPGSRSGTLQREKEIPKLVVPSTQQNANYGNYDDLELCRSGGLQGSYVQHQNSATSYTHTTGASTTGSGGIQENSVPTNVQRPPVHQLHPDSSGVQYHRGGSQSPTFQIQKLQPMQQQQQLLQQHQLQQLQPQQLPDAPVMPQQSPGQTMIQPQVRGQVGYDSLGRGGYNQTVTERYTEEQIVNQLPQSLVNLPPQQHFINQTTTGQQQQQIVPQTVQQQHHSGEMSLRQQQQQQQQQQQMTGQPLLPVEQHQQVIIHETVIKRGPPGTSLPHGRTASASKDLEELMASFSEFDMNKSGIDDGGVVYSQPVKTIKVPVIPCGGSSGDSTDASGFRNSQDQSSSGYLSASTSGRGGGDYDSVALGGASPGPHEMIIQPSPSTLGHPVPSTVYSQDQSSSKMVVTQGMHGVLPQGKGGTGQAGEGQLEMMLNQLGNDLSQQGILTLPKGDCAACNKSIVGQVLMALGRIWHPEHFVCVHCRRELGTDTFFERDGQPYCENDYQVLFSPKCALCGGAILEKCITALNKTWHPEHFFCAECQRPFGEEGFHEQNGMPYCRDDYFCMFAPKCGGCGNAILSNYFTALQRQWHPECFVCRECYAPFDSGSFFDHNGLPYCEQHFHAQRGSLCASCQQPITGRCIAAMYRKFHPEHFVCVFCLQPLNKGTFKEQGNKPYCHQCFEKLFG